MKKRNDLKQQSIVSNDSSKLLEYKMLRNQIRSKLRKEKDEYYAKKIFECHNDVKQLWRTSYQILGQSQDLSPKHLIYNDSYISSPQLLAESFNDIFINKVEKVKSNIAVGVNVNPIDRLNKWLSQRESPIPVFDWVSQKIC